MARTAGPVERILAQVHGPAQPDERPFVTLTYAQSLDGSLAARRDRPLALSGPQAQVMTHRLRAAHDAILIGIGTLLADDPRLTVRLAGGADPQPVILDSRLRTPIPARVFQRRPPWIATTSALDLAQSAGPGAARDANDLAGRAAALEASGARLLRLPGDDQGRVWLPALLECLAGLGVRRLMVEGGAAVITSFLKARLVDSLVVTIAPRLVGGQPAVESPLEQEDSGFPLIPGYDCARLGDDLVIWGHPSWPATV